ncbi:MAG: beta-propeller fold lactonase family protein [Xanthobacteraceae bacterium]
MVASADEDLAIAVRTRHGLSFINVRFPKRGTLRRDAKAMRQRRPFRHRSKNVGGAENWLHILRLERKAASDNQQRDILRKDLRNARESVLDAGPCLGREHAVAFAAFDARIAVGDTDANTLLPTQYRSNVQRRTCFDQRIAWIAGEKLRTVAFKNFGNNCGAVHLRLFLGFVRPTRVEHSGSAPATMRQKAFPFQNLAKSCLVTNFATERQPRGINIDPSGQYLVASGEKSDRLSVYRIDQVSGKLGDPMRYPVGKGANWIEIVEMK